MAKKRKKKTSRKRLIDRCDNLCKRVVKIRDEYICQKCGKKVSKQNCHWSHVVPRADLWLRWDLLNSMAMCYHCHHYWWHKDPLGASKWFEETFPARADYLRQKRVGTATNTMRETDIEKVEQFLQEKLKELQ